MTAILFSHICCEYVNIEFEIQSIQIQLHVIKLKQFDARHCSNLPPAFEFSKRDKNSNDRAYILRVPSVVDPLCISAENINVKPTTVQF